MRKPTRNYTRRDALIRTCTKCSETFPNTEEFFYYKNRKTSTLMARCRGCDSERCRQQRTPGMVTRPRPITGRDDETRTCSDCDKTFPNTREYFQYANTATGQLRPNCIACRNKKARDASWAAGKKRPMEVHLAELAKRPKKPKVRYPETMRRYKLKRRADKWKAEGSHTLADIRLHLEQQKGLCYWCKKDVRENYHVDHIFALSRGGSNGPENICIACPDCNRRKHNKTPLEFAGRLF